MNSKSVRSQLAFRADPFQGDGGAGRDVCQSRPPTISASAKANPAPAEAQMTTKRFQRGMIAPHSRHFTPIPRRGWRKHWSCQDKSSLAGWRTPLFLEVCDLPEGPVGGLSAPAGREVKLDIVVIKRHDEGVQPPVPPHWSPKGSLRRFRHPTRRTHALERPHASICARSQSSGGQSHVPWEACRGNNPHMGGVVC